MQMRVDRLREAFNLVGPAVPKKPSIKALEYILLKDGFAVVNDLESAIALELPEAEGACLLPFRSLYDLLKRVPGNEIISLEQTNTHLELHWPGGRVTYSTFDPQDYPPFPQVEALVEKSVDGDSLVPVLTTLIDYCATEKTRPVLCGVTMILGEEVQLAASDGFRMALQNLPISLSAEGITSIIIPTSAIRLLEHLWKNTPRPALMTDSLIKLVTARRELDLTLGNVMLQARVGMATLITRLIEGTPPTFHQLVPKESPITLTFLAPELERALRGIGNLAKNGKGIVRLTWSETTMTLSVKDSDQGGAEMALPVNASAPGKTALNINYMLEFVKGKQGMVTVAVDTPKSPVLFQYSASPLLVVMMPMFVEWGSETEEQAEVATSGEAEVEVVEEVAEEQAPEESDPEGDH